MKELLVTWSLTGAGAVSALRWLRVAQREHYLAGSATRFATRWWRSDPRSVAILLVGVVGIGLMALDLWFGLVPALAAAAGPFGLSLRGRTSPLAWTGRLRRLAAVTGVLLVLGGLLGALTLPVITAFLALASHLAVDAALAIVAPLERRLGTPWVEKAAGALHESGSTVVAVTGSYGKTSTKGHIAQLVAGSRRVLPSPASFNNRMGLARAINENLADGIDVFVAEMGTYGPGEIAELCSWIRPDIAVITAIGPVHLERFGTEERIVEAKSEILEHSSTAVLNVDDPRLREVAEREATERWVITVGSRDADVTVEGSAVMVRGEPVGNVPPGLHPGNVGCAVAVATALGVDRDHVAHRLSALTEPEHRLTVAQGRSGVTVIDDTFNSNPAGADAALSSLEAAEATGRRVVVTPGMVELGQQQAEANRHFAERAARVADHLIVVGNTNRRALVDGARGGPAVVMEVATREEAVEWVRQNLGAGDVVLYENDLPDHYP